MNLTNVFGFSIFDGGIKPLSPRIMTISRYPIPTDIAELRLFLVWLVISVVLYSARKHWGQIQYF